MNEAMKNLLVEETSSLEKPVELLELETLPDDELLEITQIQNNSMDL